jgi:hypothetical protein
LLLESRRRVVKSAEPLLEFLAKQLRQAETSWSIGSFGAIARHSNLELD